MDPDPYKLFCFSILSNLLCFLQVEKTIVKFFFSSNLVNLDLDLGSDPDLYPDLYLEPDLYPEPDPHSEKLLDLDPDPHKMNADPHPWNFIR